MSKLFSSRRVVVTGVGAITSVGFGKDKFWNNLLSGKSGISKISSMDISNARTIYGGEIKEFDANSYMNGDKILNYGRTSHLGIAATKLALDDAKLMND